MKPILGLCREPRLIPVNSSSAPGLPVVGSIELKRAAGKHRRGGTASQETVATIETGCTLDVDVAQCTAFAGAHIHRGAVM
jgi:hypothetical protein